MGIVSTGGKGVRKILTWVATVAQAGIAIAIVYIVADRLFNTDVNIGDRSVSTSCGLDPEPTDDGLCQAAFTAVAITFAALFGLSLVFVRPKFMTQRLSCLCSAVCSSRSPLARVRTLCPLCVPHCLASPQACAHSHG